MKDVAFILRDVALGLTCAVFLHQSVLTAHAQPATGDGQKPAPSEIEGAFGLKLGDDFDVRKGVLVEPARLGEVRFEHDHQAIYKFTPQKPLSPFDSYYVEITPKTRKICSIFAVAKEKQLFEKKEELDVVVAALLAKYSGQKDNYSNFSVAIDGRQVTQSRKNIQLTQQSLVNAVYLKYSDDELMALSVSERSEVAKAENDGKQRDLEKKAKALDPSGL